MYICYHIYPKQSNHIVPSSKTHFAAPSSPIPIGSLESNLLQPLGKNRIPWTCLLLPRSRPNEQGHLRSAGSTGSKSNGDIADSFEKNGTWDVLFFLHPFPGFYWIFKCFFFVLGTMDSYPPCKKPGESNRGGEIQKNNRWWHVLASRMMSREDYIYIVVFPYVYINV